ncbi:MAG TPA: hypothetical protein VFE32_17315 [Puia sp.]|jgi:hypothetical protein|nr:hypothetical protein [Puia sp.]
MIPKLKDNEQAWWDDRTQEFTIRSRRASARPRFTDRTIVLIILLAVMLVGAIGVCTTLCWEPGPLTGTFYPWDSTLENHSQIPVPDSLTQ